jgi:hypothetical protein
MLLQHRGQYLQDLFTSLSAFAWHDFVPFLFAAVVLRLFSRCFRGVQLTSAAACA